MKDISKTKNLSKSELDELIIMCRLNIAFVKFWSTISKLNKLSNILDGFWSLEISSKITRSFFQKKVKVVLIWLLKK